MRVFRVLGFYLTSIAILGSLGFVGWLWSDRILFHSPLWPVDALSTWLIALVITAAFLIAICTPLQLLARRRLGVFAGALSGPAFVWLLLMLRDEPLSIRNYLTAPGVVPLHLIFSTVGLLFALSFRVYGPNNSSKWKPLRGST